MAATTHGDPSWPTEIRLLGDRKTLAVAFEDGARFELPAEYLRVESPSAEVQGHGPGEKIVLGGKRDVAIVSIEPVGSYAVRLGFDDGHRTGLYDWSYLRRLGEQRAVIWATYLRELAARGLSRDR